MKYKIYNLTNEELSVLKKDIPPDDSIIVEIKKGKGELNSLIRSCLIRIEEYIEPVKKHRRRK